jgi:hypothetical protein
VCWHGRGTSWVVSHACQSMSTSIQPWCPSALRLVSHQSLLHLCLQAGVKQLAAAACSHPSLHVLDLSGTTFTDACLRALKGQGSRWPWQHQACQQLQELSLAGSNSLSGAAVAQLAKLLAAAQGLGALHRLDLTNCPSISDTGTPATVLPCGIAGICSG